MSGEGGGEDAGLVKVEAAGVFRVVGGWLIVLTASGASGPRGSQKSRRTSLFQ